MSEADTKSAAGLFYILAHLTADLLAADKKNQSWTAETVSMLDAEGDPSGGLDIRIRIYPPGVTPGT